ncbi:hypothetical protein DERF_005870 [Dermatophagoides farinae]|uniref:Uncharacterized protein n=1 Tax=Dermatophagoides farinae TaxID=6954 RepID=A0A922I6P8_DERFA|nr:hypothetical protein DERF_005870 [Dermatophagoides farinae]
MLYQSNLHSQFIREKNDEKLSKDFRLNKIQEDIKREKINSCMNVMNKINDKKKYDVIVVNINVDQMKIKTTYVA